MGAELLPSRNAEHSLQRMPRRREDLGPSDPPFPVHGRSAPWTGRGKAGAGVPASTQSWPMALRQGWDTGRMRWTPGPTSSRGKVPGLTLWNPVCKVAVRKHGAGRCSAAGHLNKSAKGNFPPRYCGSPATAQLFSHLTQRNRKK